MSDRRRSARRVAAVYFVLAAPLAAAQETSSQLSGFVTGNDGQPIPGARVTIVHTPTGTTRTATTSDSGRFTAAGLRVGGPYRVTVQAEGMQDAIVERLQTRLGQRASVALVAEPIATLAGVEVTGAFGRDLSNGAGARFTGADVRAVPSISRDIKDVVSVNPKAWADPSNSDALEVAGVNNRYNTITVDGVRQSDDFGLNSNGYPTQRSPLSVDAIEAVSVLSAPFSVEYASFRGSAINMVTRSGTNELKGSAFYYRGDDSDEEIHGGTLGGPLINDRLFFFLSYEKLERETPQDIGPEGSGFPVEVPGVTQDEYDEIRQIGLDVYGYDIGRTLTSAPEEDEKILAKIDWNITGQHRAALAYQRTEGNELIVNTTNNNAGLGRVGAPSNWYDRAILMETASLQLFSDWNEHVSTEFKFGRKEVKTAQVSLFGTDFGEMIIDTPDGGTVYIGSDEFRQANELTNDLDSIKVAANFYLGDHTLTAGYEREMLDFFNVFVPRSQGQWVFNPTLAPDGVTLLSTGIENFTAQAATSLSYQNATTNDAADGAAIFGYDVDSFYLQDEWQPTPDVQVQAGVRLDRYAGSDRPQLNENFTARYGFNNLSTLDGRYLFMPRIGFNWQSTPETTLYGGFGLFGGGTPNVWISNSFSNDGVTVVRDDIVRDTGDPLEGALDGVDGFDIPQDVQDNIAGLRNDGAVNAIDPDFDIPSQYRWNLGLTHALPRGIELKADLIYSRVKDEVFWQDIRLQQVATAPDGRPVYGPRADGRNSASIQDFLLTNTSRGEQTVLTVEASKTWHTGAGRFDGYLGYGHQDVKDVNPGTSSTASSNWDNVAVSDPNDPRLATSNYEIEHRFTGSFAWRKSFFGDYETSLVLVGERRSGRPYSYTFGAGSLIWGDPRQASRQRQLFYVPDGDVIFEGACTAAEVGVVAGCATAGAFSASSAAAGQFAGAMDRFIRDQGLEKYRGRIMPRNSHTSPWVSVLNLRFAQELPIFRRVRGIVMFDIENFANLIDKDWGQLRQVNFPYVAPVADAVRIATTGCPGNAPSCYVYRPRSGQTGPTKPFEAIATLPSAWRMQLGFRIEF